MHTKQLKYITLLLFVIMAVVSTTRIKQKTFITLQTFCEKQSAVYTANFNLPKEDIRYLDRHKLHSEKSTAFLKSKTLQSNEHGYHLKVYPKIRLVEYKFSSEQKAAAALDSLLTCFPNACQPIQKGKNTSAKITPGIMVFNQRQICMAVSYCAHRGEQWEEFKKAFVQTYVQPQSTIILTGCGSLKWATGKEMLKG